MWLDLTLDVSSRSDKATNMNVLRGFEYETNLKEIICRDSFYVITFYFRPFIQDHMRVGILKNPRGLGYETKSYVGAFHLVRFYFGPLVQGQTSVGHRKSACNLIHNPYMLMMCNQPYKIVCCESILKVKRTCPNFQ